MDKSKLEGNWIHSHEEDADGNMIFRPEGFQLPLTRAGRAAIDLKNDNSYVLKGDIGALNNNLLADDRYKHENGTWAIDDNNILNLHTNQDMQKLEIVSIAADKLVVKKHQ